MAAKDKDTIYIDVDDEITGIIDKLKVSEGKVVALVLPKRASVFQSIVNMKLLKRAADSSKKNLVLITSEAGLLPLAGAAGVHVAKTLTSKPEIPSAPSFDDAAEETVNEDEPVSPLANGDTPIGQLAGATPPPPPADGGVETLVLDDDDLPPEAATPAAKTFEPPSKGKGEGKGTKKNKKLHIPNFNRFRMFLIIGGLILLLLIIGFIIATIGSKATINIKTDATNVDTNLTLNLSTNATSLDQANSIVPAKLASQQKTYTEQAPTTGQKNNGNKASGSVSMSAGSCSGNIPDDVPAGTGLSSNGQTYITQSDVSFVPEAHGKQCTFQGQSDVTIIAQNAGSSYNNATSFTVAGRSDVSVAVSSAISGGTDNIVQIVNQNDVTTAKNKIPASDSSVKQALQSQLKGDNLYPIDATYTVGTPSVTSSPNVGQVGNTVTVTETVTYTEFGVKESDLNTLIDNNVNTQIDSSKQRILDTGLSNAIYNVNTVNSTSAQLGMSTKATAGPTLNIASIKRAAAGQKAGAIESQLNNNPDVTSVNVKFSPFWVSSAPKKTSQITINIAKPTTTAKASSSGASQP